MMLYILMVCLSIFIQEGELVVLPTESADQFKIIYKGDLKWNVVLTIVNEKGKTVYEREVKNSDNFIIPISMGREESGEYTVEIATPVYDLSQTFVYQRYLDRAAELLDIEYDESLQLIRLTSKEAMKEKFFVFIYNESGDRLISDEVSAQGLTMRTYKLKGAPAKQVQILVEMNGVQIRNEKFDF